MDIPKKLNDPVLIEIYRLFMNANWSYKVIKKGKPKTKWPYDEAYNLFIQDLYNGKFKLKVQDQERRGDRWRKSSLLKIEFLLHFFDIDPQSFYLDEISSLIHRYFRNIISIYVAKVRKRQSRENKRFILESQLASSKENKFGNTILEYFFYKKNISADDRDEFSRLLLMRFYRQLRRFPRHKKIVRFIIKGEVNIEELLLFVAGSTDVDKLRDELSGNGLIDFSGNITEKLEKIDRPSGMKLSKCFRNIQKRVYHLLRGKFSPEVIAFCLNEKLSDVERVLAELLDFFCNFLDGEIDRCKNYWPEFSEAFIIRRFERLFPDKFISRKIRVIRKAKEIDEYCRNKETKSFRETG